MKLRKNGSKDPLEEDFQSALDCFKKKEIEKAKLICSQILEENPNHGNTLNLLGIICSNEGAFDEALALIQQAIEQHPQKAADFNVNLALVYLLMGNIQTAASLYYKAAKLFFQKGDKKEALLYFAKGAYLLRDHGYLQEAKDFYLKMLEVNPTTLSAHNDLGLIFMQEKKWKNAAACFNEVLELDPTYSPAYNNLGLIFYFQKKLEKAASLFEKAVEQNPLFLEAHINLGNIYREQEDFEKAETHLTKAQELSPNHPGLINNLGILLLHQNKVEEAISHFKKAVELDPSYSEAADNLAKALEAQEAKSETPAQA